MWPTDPRADDDDTWGVEIIAALPHDSAAFTQGLEFVDGRLLESTGCHGRSELREIDPATGEVVARAPLPPAQFGEGLTAVGTEIIQLTWESGIARRLDATTFAEAGQHTYVGEGWGICAGEDSLVMSNGSTMLTHRDPITFAPIRTVEVRRDGDPITALNELECVDGLVMANVRRSDDIVVIDPDSGEVMATVDAGALRADIGTDKREEILNGIAAVGDGTLVLGGKHWPRFFVVRLTVG